MYKGLFSMFKCMGESFQDFEAEVRLKMLK